MGSEFAVDWPYLNELADGLGDPERPIREFEL
jgi:hypothetical protein